jgi:deazaflavin-dependent oxidoreductase (nitroreductase family)
MKGLMGAFIALSVALYRMSGGRIMGTSSGAPVLLLTTTGRKSGRSRTVPLLYVQDGACFVVVASYAGSPKHPAWYLNLEQNPKVELQVGRRRFAAVARSASADEKTRLWPKLTEIYPRYEDYQKRTSREIPLVILIP